MLSKGRELKLSLAAVILISAVYALVSYRLGGSPAAQSLFGHGLGILGFVLMLLTETLYSLRKRSQSARWGRMSIWLQFHIFTGLVGPFMVLLHSAWQFRGLAGLVTLLTVVIVASGFFGRYIYTAVPRTSDGAELHSRQLEQEINLLAAEIAQQTALQPDFQAYANANPLLQGNRSQMVLGRILRDVGARRRGWAFVSGQAVGTPERREAARQLAGLVSRRNRLQREIASLAAARSTLAVWHSIHVPIGMALFLAALVHIAAAIYFSFGMW